MLLALVKEMAEEIHVDEVDLRQREEALEEKRVTLRVLQRRLQSQSSTVQQQPHQRPRVRLEEISLDGKVSFMDAFNQAVRALQGSDVYIAPVYDRMVQLGLDVADERTLRLRIGTELSRLEERGVLLKTRQGGGNVPNMYRHRETNTNGAVDLA